MVKFAEIAEAKRAREAKVSGLNIHDVKQI